MSQFKKIESVCGKRDADDLRELSAKVAVLEEGLAKLQHGPFATSDSKAGLNPKGDNKTK